MLKTIAKLAGEVASEHLVREVSKTLSTAPVEELSEEQKAFDRRIRMAQHALGLVCPPASKAMFVLEHGPAVMASIIQRAYGYYTDSADRTTQ